MLAAREDTMIGSNLIAEIPWIIFGVLLAAVCVRLRRFGRLPGRQSHLESRQPTEGCGDNSAARANAGEPGGDDRCDVRP
jgi:hypothetical protein